MMGILWESYKHCGLFLVDHCTNCDGESLWAKNMTEIQMKESARETKRYLCRSK